jgi:hypothetical protein
MNRLRRLFATLVHVFALELTMFPGRPTHHNIVRPTPVRPTRNPRSEAQRESSSDLVTGASEKTVTRIDNRDSFAEIAIGVRESCPAAA